MKKQINVERTSTGTLINSKELNETTWATDWWYGKEVDKINWNDLKFVKGTGHFTQIVWKSSTKLGMGVAGKYVVGRYKEAGNCDSLYATNVFPKA